MDQGTGSASPSGIAVDSAIEAFVRGLCFTRSITHPYLAHRVGPVWVVRDGPRTRDKDYRRDEWIAHRTDPAAVDRMARTRTRGRYAICAIRAANEPDEPLRSAYKSLGYRLGTTEPLMAHTLQRIPRLPAPYPVRRVTTPDLAERLARAARARPIASAYFGSDSPLRQYIALDGERPVGWVRSVAAGDAAWVASMHVEPAYRRRGIGRSLLARMLRDDRAAGATASVLLSSHTGAMLYPHLGYELIGELLLFTPKRQ